MPARTSSPAGWVAAMCERDVLAELRIELETENVFTYPQGMLLLDIAKAAERVSEGHSRTGLEWLQDLAALRQALARLKEGA
jgi:hypothetical protein